MLRFLSLFRYDIIYFKVRQKWFGRQDFASKFIELKKWSDFMSDRFSYSEVNISYVVLVYRIFLRL